MPIIGSGSTGTKRTRATCCWLFAICMLALSSYAGPLVPRREVTLARSFLGIPGAAERYTIAIVPPQK